MEGKGTFFIMLMVIVILVVTIAALTIFIFYGNIGKNDVAITSQHETRAPKDNEIGYIKLFSDMKYCNLKPDEQNTSPIMQIDITLYYFKKVKGIKDVEQKIVQHGSKLREAVGLYFQEKTIKEIKSNPLFWATAKEELKEELNKLLTSNEKDKNEIIYEVVFDTWNYQ